MSRSIRAEVFAARFPEGIPGQEAERDGVVPLRGRAEQKGMPRGVIDAPPGSVPVLPRSLERYLGDRRRARTPLTPILLQAPECAARDRGGRGGGAS